MKSENANNTTVTVDHKNIPKGWQPVVLGDFINTKHGYAFKGKNIVKEPMRDILVTPGNFRIGGGFKNSKFKYFNGEYPKSYILKENDIIVTMTDLSKDGDTLGYSAKVPKSNNEEKYLHNQRIGLVEFLNDKIDKDFIYWLLRTKDYHGFIVGAATGTSIRHTSPITIKEYEFFLPPLPEQKTIVSVLSSLDDKIDLLHRQNKTLETMAETLFRQWFIEEAKEDWEEKPLSFYGNIVCGKTPSKKKKEYFNGGIPFIKIPDMHGNTFVFQTSDSLSEEGRNSQSNKTLPAKSICVSCIATVGLVSMTVKESQTNQQINSIVPYKNHYRYYLYLFMKNFTNLLTAMASGGTATLNLNTGNFSKIKVSLPDENILKECHKVIEPLFDKIFNNQKQIRTLEQMRDTLLPKLMSGEVKVDYNGSP